MINDNREKEAWYALRTAKQKLNVLVNTDGALSLRLHRTINELHVLAKHLNETSKNEGEILHLKNFN